MLQIGQRVKYLRRTPQGLVEGTGILKGLGMDGNNRAMALVRDGEDSFNTPTACLNYKSGFREKFEMLITTVDALTKEGNARVESVTKTYNDRIAELEDDLLGKPISSDAPEKLQASDQVEGEVKDEEKPDPEVTGGAVTLPVTDENID